MAIKTHFAGRRLVPSRDTTFGPTGPAMSMAYYALESTLHHVLVSRSDPTMDGLPLTAGRWVALLVLR